MECLHLARPTCLCVERSSIMCLLLAIAWYASTSVDRLVLVHKLALASMVVYDSVIFPEIQWGGGVKAS